MNKPITLTILHNIFLDKEERYKLYNGESLEIIGVSMPVWFFDGKTTEPGKEIFCKYKLHNRNGNFPIKNWKEGYEINIPQANGEIAADAKKNVVARQETGKMPNPKGLLNNKDGGCEWLAFKQYNKIRRNKKTYNILHFVEIKDMKALEETIV